MPDNDLEERMTDFMYALAASDANVVNISADRPKQDMQVTFDLLDPEDADLVRDVAEEHGFEQDGDTGEQFYTVD